MLSGVIGTIKAAFLCLDDCIDAIRIGSGNGDADLAEDSSGKPVAFEVLPCNAIIFRSVEPAAGTAAGEKPRLSSRLPERREHDVRIMRIENNVNPASIFILR